MSVQKNITKWIRKERYLLFVALATTIPCLVVLTVSGALSPKKTTQPHIQYSKKYSEADTSKTKEKSEKKEVDDIIEPIFY